MRLTKIHIANYKSIWDSTEIDIAEVTCLVGKNESGKTALLQALYRLNPLKVQDEKFDVTMEYPRQALARYRRQVANGEVKPANVVRATYALDCNDIEAVQAVFGDQCFTVQEPEITLSKGYSNITIVHDLDINEEAIMEHLISTANLQVEDTKLLHEKEAPAEVLKALQEIDETENSEELARKMKTVVDKNFTLLIYQETIKDRLPKFLYFDEYNLMRGQDNLDSLAERVRTNDLYDSDYPLLGLISLAGLELDELLNPSQTQALTAEISAAESELSEMILPYWSQNRNLRMKFDVRVGLPDDPDGMQHGMNIWGLVVNTKYNVELPIGTRSRGFIWFFSFLAWYSKLRDDNENLILLLDEPGLSLHAKAQEDLLRYIEVELKPNHQVVYTTHSPFMVDPLHFDRIRIVQDRSIEQSTANLPKDQQGTKVTTDALKATPDSLFPLQGALGYEIYQNLFIGPNCLIVEGPSDLLYIQTISSLLPEDERLSRDWTVTPVGGASNVATFAALIRARSNLNVALLLDSRGTGWQKIEGMIKQTLLEQNNVLTYDIFVPKRKDADVEDMFDPEFYLNLVSNAYEVAIGIDDLPQYPPRILKRLEAYLKDNSLLPDFDHYFPARYFYENVGKLENSLSDSTLDRWKKAFAALNNILRK